MLAQRPDLEATTQRVVNAILARVGAKPVSVKLPPGGAGATATAADLQAMQRRIAGAAGPQPAPVPSLPPPTSATKPTLAWVQKSPIGSNSKFGIPVGYLNVSGGIGPFLFAYSDPTGKYRSRADGTLWTAEVAVGSGTDTLSAYVIDGVGNKSAPVSFTITKFDVDGAGLNSPNPLPSFAPIWSGRLRTDAAPLFSPGAYGPSHADVRQDSISVVDPAGVWVGSGPTIWAPKGLPPVGNYPVTINITNATSKITTSLSETLAITAVPDPVALFHSTAVWTDTTPPGTIIGMLAATVPDNAPGFTIQSPYLTVDAARHVIVTAPAPVGDLTIAYTVTSGGSALSMSFTAKVAVQKGIQLAPTAMTLALNKLDNSVPAQKVGPLAVNGQTGGKWLILTQSDYNPNAISGQYGDPARYQVDATGLVYTPPNCLLSFQDPSCGWEDDKITVVWTSDDGLTTCQQAFTIPVADVTNVQILTATDKASLHAAAVTSNHAHPAGTKYQVDVAYNADPNAYTDATRGDDTKIGWVGPTVINFLPGPNGEMPRLGGKADNTGVSSGITSYGKGYFIASEGDVCLQGRGMISGVHGGGSTDGKEGLRKDGNTKGNLVISDLTIQDCDQGLESGVCHGKVFVQRMTNRRNGGASVGAGLTHGFYIGSVTKFELVDSYIDATLYGHLLKSRARQTIIRRCKIIDSGSAACCVDLPDGGDVLIEDSFLVKGPFATNPSVINFGAENGAWDVNRLVLNRNTIIVGAISFGGNYGNAAAVAHYHLPGASPSSVSGDGNKIWLSPLAQVSADVTVYATAGTTALTNTTMLSVPPKIPALPGLMTRPHSRRAVTEASPFGNFNSVPVLMDNPFPYVTATGKVATLTPTGDLVSGADPFAAGWTSALATDPVYNQRSLPAGAPWAPAAAFVMSGGDLIYNGGLAPGGYFVQPQFTSTDGKTVANHRVLVTVAA